MNHAKENSIFACGASKPETACGSACGAGKKDWIPIPSILCTAFSAGTASGIALPGRFTGWDVIDG